MIIYYGEIAPPTLIFTRSIYYTNNVVDKGGDFAAIPR